jgi:predicted ATPase
MKDNAKLPLFIITGASGNGKTTVVPHNDYDRYIKYEC